MVPEENVEVDRGSLTGSREEEENGEVR